MYSIIRSFSSFSREIPNHRLSFDLAIYLVANRPSFQSEKLFLEKIRAAVKGGISCVQFRDHENNLSTTIRTARRIKEITRDVPLFINTLSPFEVVKATAAAGVYLEENFSYLEARKILGKNLIIGVPVKTIDEVLSIQLAQEIDYVSVKISASKKTCPRNDQLWGLDGLRRVRTITPHRIVAIGGLNLSCIEPVYKELHSNDGIAMAGGLMDEESPDVTIQNILSIRQKIYRR
ncbi:MAG: thiamine phosphate synthase [Chlamydiota bacterium]